MNRKKAIRNILFLGGGAAALLAGIKTYTVLKKPAFSKLDEFQPVINQLAELIIPETDTPGAAKAGAGTFVSLMVRDCTSRQSQNNFIDGLEDLIAYSSDQYNKPFLKCSADEQVKVLAHFEKKGKPSGGMRGKIESRYLGESFFTTLKKYTVMGYCTSRLGATGGLAYDYIPGGYQGSLTLQPGQKAWATH